MPHAKKPGAPSKGSGPRLTEQMLRFIDEYMRVPDAKAAAIAAGYGKAQAASQGSQLLNHPLVGAELAERQAKLREKAGIDAEWVVARLRLISDRCVQGEPVTDKDGNATGEWKFDAAGANKATELLGKTLGMFRDKVEVTGRDGGPLEVEVSDARQRLADRLRGARQERDPGGPG
jgi:phage terminase small subunit